jgi:hypothetical protein
MIATPYLPQPTVARTKEEKGRKMMWELNASIKVFVVSGILSKFAVKRNGTPAVTNL